MQRLVTGSSHQTFKRSTAECREGETMLPRLSGPWRRGKLSRIGYSDSRIPFSEASSLQPAGGCPIRTVNINAGQVGSRDTLLVASGYRSCLTPSHKGINQPLLIRSLHRRMSPGEGLLGCPAGWGRVGEMLSTKS
jgi:hypothetical protein